MLSTLFYFPFERSNWRISNSINYALVFIVQKYYLWHVKQMWKPPGKYLIWNYVSMYFFCSMYALYTHKKKNTFQCHKGSEWNSEWPFASHMFSIPNEKLKLNWQWCLSIKVCLHLKLLFLQAALRLNLLETYKWLDCRSNLNMKIRMKVKFNWNK